MSATPPTTAVLAPSDCAPAPGPAPAPAPEFAAAVESLQYQRGFGNQFASEAIPGALPVGRNSPQRAPFGLYAELISGSAFTAPRAQTHRTRMYRSLPPARHRQPS